MLNIVTRLSIIVILGACSQTYVDNTLSLMNYNDINYHIAKANL